MYSLQKTAAVDTKAHDDSKTLKRKLNTAAQAQIAKLIDDAHDACKTMATTRQPARVIVKVIVMVTAGQPQLPNMEA